jgi:hypothetical protein
VVVASPSGGTSQQLVLLDASVIDH